MDFTHHKSTKYINTIMKLNNVNHKEEKGQGSYAYSVDCKGFTP